MSALFNTPIYTTHQNAVEGLFRVTQPMPMVPRAERRTGSAIIQIKQYLQRVIFKQAGNTVTQLPSITTLASMFESSTQDIQAVLNEFHAMGFEYAMANNRAPILIWDAL